MAEVTFQKTIRETSPLWTFAPLSLNDSTRGWVSQCGLPAPIYACDDHFARFTSVSSQANLTFSGTQIEVFGNSTGGMTWSMQVDDQSVLSSSDAPTSSQPQLLATFKDLTSGQHTLKLTVLAPQNGVGVGFTLDRAEATVGTGVSGGAVQTTYIDDQSSAISYTNLFYQYPNYNGTDTPSQISASTFHASQDLNNHASLSFNGSAVALYGPCYLACGGYAVSIDSEAATSYNGSIYTPTDTAGACLRYLRTGLDSEREHTLTLSATEQGRWATLDWVEVYSVPDAKAISGTQSGSGSGSSGSGSKGSDIGAIVGGVVGGVAGALLLLIAFFLHRKRRQRRRGAAVVSGPSTKKDRHETPGRSSPFDLEEAEKGVEDTSPPTSGSFPSSYPTLSHDAGSGPTPGSDTRSPTNPISTLSSSVIPDSHQSEGDTLEASASPSDVTEVPSSASWEKGIDPGVGAPGGHHDEKSVPSLSRIQVSSINTPAPLSSPDLNVGGGASSTFSETASGNVLSPSNASRGNESVSLSQISQDVNRILGHLGRLRVTPGEILDEDEESSEEGGERTGQIGGETRRQGARMHRERPPPPGYHDVAHHQENGL